MHLKLKISRSFLMIPLELIALEISNLQVKLFSTLVAIDKEYMLLQMSLVKTNLKSALYASLLLYSLMWISAQFLNWTGTRKRGHYDIKSLPDCHELGRFMLHMLHWIHTDLE